MPFTFQQYFRQYNVLCLLPKMETSTGSFYRHNISQHFIVKKKRNIIVMYANNRERK